MRASKTLLRGLLLLTGTFAYLAPLKASEQACRSFTGQQEALIHKAYEYGQKEGLGYTLSAIVIQESFVDSYVVKMFPDDGSLGSYGITHIYLTTAMYYENVESRWVALEQIAPKLINDDEYSLELSVRKLKTYWKNHSKTDWIGLWKSYNGTGLRAERYAQKIVEHVNMLQDCFTLQEDLEERELMKSFWEIPSFIPYSITGE